MTLKITTEDEFTLLQPLTGRSVAVLGYGNQGAAHAPQNLRDSGVSVVLGARRGGQGAGAAADEGFTVLPIDDAVAGSDLVIIALPDELHGQIWPEQIAPALRPGATVGFLHGASVRFGQVTPAPGVGVVMVAPKGPGPTLRARFLRGQGIPCLFAVHQDSTAGDAEALGLAWAAGLGCARAAIVHATFAAEAETDLFGEQAVLCGGVLSLVRGAFETLVEAGYDPQLAYMECCQELKQVTDLLYTRGPSGMMQAISNSAEFGAHATAPQLMTTELRNTLRAMLKEIRAGRFTERLAADHDAGFPWFQQQREALSEHPIESAGHAVRGWMPWLSDEDSLPERDSTVDR